MLMNLICKNQNGILKMGEGRPGVGKTERAVSTAKEGIGERQKGCRDVTWRTVHGDGDRGNGRKKSGSRRGEGDRLRRALELQARGEGLGGQTLAHVGQVQMRIHGDRKVGQERSVLSSTDTPQKDGHGLTGVLEDAPRNPSSQKLVSL